MAQRPLGLLLLAIFMLIHLGLISNTTANAETHLLNSLSSTEKTLYVYVIPGFQQTKGWPADDHWHVAMISAAEPTEVLVDTDRNGPDRGDVKVSVSPGQRASIGAVEKWNPTLAYDGSVLVLYSEKPVTVFYDWLTNDWGIYDETMSLIGAPPAATKLVGYGRDFYITCVMPGCSTKVYVNGSLVGVAKYGDVLELHYDRWVSAVIEANKPIVAITFSYDASSRDKVAGAPAVPPQPGYYWIPPSLKQYYEHLGVNAVEEKCLVFNDEAKLVRIIDMGKRPKMLSFNIPVAILCYRKVVHVDPWTGSPRTVLSYFPVYGNSLIRKDMVEAGFVRPYGSHGGCSILFVGAYNHTLVKIDYEPYGSIDKELVLEKGNYLILSPDNIEKQH